MIKRNKSADVSEPSIDSKHDHPNRQGHHSCDHQLRENDHQALHEQLEIVQSEDDQRIGQDHSYNDVLCTTLIMVVVRPCLVPRDEVGDKEAVDCDD